MVRSMDSGYTLGKMVQLMRAGIQMIKNKVMENL